jgi:hypothetical protein
LELCGSSRIASSRSSTALPYSPLRSRAQSPIAPGDSELRIDPDGPSVVRHRFVDLTLSKRRFSISADDIGYGRSHEEPAQQQDRQARNSDAEQNGCQLATARRSRHFDAPNARSVDLSAAPDCPANPVDGQEKSDHGRA